MPTGGGFYTEQQEANFRVANVQHRRGGAAEVVCGARTRTGGHCGQKPLAESRRCLRHAGPHAARAFRERQIRDLAKGKITPAEFAAHEARRAANRLRDNWKKNPWLVGSTIDLGEHEWSFQQESGLAHRHEPISPAVMDWLRWKYRRLQLDRKRDAEWVRVLRDEFPRRVQNTRPPSSADLAGFEQQSRPTAAHWTVGGRVAFTKRRNPDHTWAPSSPKISMLRRVKVSNAELADLGRLATEHHQLVNSLFAACHNDGERQALLVALRDVTSKPGDTKAQTVWTKALVELRSR
ncbi:hypothetical protein EN866_33175 [Mesorhizobium sp. M2D.F.Ca.ET.223.01.1.1]|uniref:hypothetical protein n=1 Tax=Mesorhizobium sp. M2D.F.Ca.ET.223.01.1.1 TaxID=2563940 RepID=UPI001091E263|nr:hypothetical protein [Mesorhizobium sp. M2D.F.Ca.ET.223.01.1.1]TGR84564.1 hypothetical protein EN866_33175 [Mesorhizobium sp. M2D.F.Ca.ET.223.01.1.1]TGT65974.1 hypothetical protein EN802_30675 [bacterium M00.F.Ca.ET.159.01.1.1]TGT79659.1 hypothetical protein EN800_30015 [bacterium M00.F.Ca.ET.157.01.1.1]